MPQHGGRVGQYLLSGVVWYQQPTIVIRWKPPTAASLKLSTKSH
ncbi:hypothetical protein CSAL01_11535 [Colletotrichum salicis]|uniref:Uncharacterized protein n=1 Tax=Colletotrichum salicis TaxID=1209931 RepID=A0A135UME4_9PEZI|nr:hypothetical protein CSAL01_11535 [Colletotrichum salicis]